MITLQNAEHHYDSSTRVPLPDLHVERGGERLILGLSGSGKSTLLHVLAGILHPAKGKLWVDDTEIYTLKESARDRFRGQKIGLVFQQMHLVDSLTVLDNLRLAQYMAGKKENRKYIGELCESLDISEKLHSYIDQLSQGQKQRVSIARAVVNEPVLLLADEPTSSLDDARSEDVIRLLKEQAGRSGAALIISTHDQRVKKHFSETINLDQIVPEVTV